MRKVLLVMLLLVFFSLFLPAAPVAASPSIDKSSILVQACRWMSYSPEGKRIETQWSWTPRIAFRVNGPIPAGTRFAVDFILPGKKPWITLNLTSEEVPEGGWYEYERVGLDVPEEKGTVATGLIGLRIRMMNELENTKATLFEGRFEVCQYVWHKDPLFKNKFDYYVNQDWNLPIGYVYGQWGEMQYGVFTPNKTPSLWAALWFHGEPQAEAFLYYQGKKISSATGNPGKSVATVETSEHNWSLLSFAFSNVLIFNKEEPNNHPDAFVMARNPGEYEIKVLRDGKLCRSMKFSVEADGSLTENGFASQVNNKQQKIFPVKVLGGDGPWNKQAWRKGAFYGNPLNGFVAP